MSRSRRKPFVTWTNGSNKEDKRQANRKFRRATHNTLKCFAEEDIIKFLCKLREISNVYSFNTDG